MKDREFYKSFFQLYIVLVLQNIVTLSVNLADNIMLGAYGEISLSGVTAVNQIQFLYQQLLIAFGDGMVIFCSQYWGKKQIQPMKKVIAIAMRFGVATAVMLFLVITLFPGQAMQVFTTDERIIREGVTYLRTIRFTYLFFAVTQMLLAALRSTEVAKIALNLSVLALVVNCGINYVLIFGRFGAPELGVTGAAIGTLTARILECAVLIGYIVQKEKYLRLKLADFMQRDQTLLKDYLKVLMPLLVFSVLWGINTAMQTVVLGHMNSAAIAANSAASNLYLVVKSAAVGAASAASVMIGKTIGMGDGELVKRYARKLQILFLLLAIAGGILLYFIRIPVLSLYDLSPETMELANQFLIILSVVYVAMAYQMPTNAGIIKGGGSVYFSAKLDTVCICLIVIPLSCYMAFVAGASSAVVVICLNIDQFIKCVPVFLKVNYGNWMKKLTREGNI
ncbi:MATE family efflux transporter [Jingyaoa shaoxingensis]|uniref:Probable multidrug resistance protein NorM n=1 Tax=Jingyaoa shaoxingensis TaxID=2763671 RepID=A0ABR7N6X7_9FIRM|nr:MATE family efflux transporter [Jingyaoa shaoxingensis]MBC8572160.1 MATE family efflux transporter [Jingyaoa shaoxingensis]